MTVYIIIETVKSESPENGQIQCSKYFETYTEARQELQERYDAMFNKSLFHQSITTREI